MRGKVATDSQSEFIYSKSTLKTKTKVSLEMPKIFCQFLKT